MYLIKEASKISGLTVRTLHHYDKIGLLSPTKAENGYRYYSDDDINRLQEILFYKYLGFPLKEIKHMLADSKSKRKENLIQQLEMLNQEKNKITKLIETLEKTIEEVNGGKKMTTEEKFQGFNFKDNLKYRDEAIKKYGEDTILESERRQNGKEEILTEEFNNIFFSLAENMNNKIDVSDEKTQLLVEEIHKNINKYSFDCSYEVFEHIGKGYVADERFKKNIDQFAEGLAEYVSEAIQLYISNK